MSSNELDTNDTAFLDSSLRPTAWEGYIGQEAVKKNLQILLAAAKERNHPPEHILFYGGPGLGKTTLAHLVAKELGASIKSTSGPAIEKVGDLASILTNLSPGDILFIDEVHRLNKLIEEVLYPAMESGSLHIVIGKGPGARSIELALPPFTLVAATTRLSLISPPLRSRFSGGIFRLEPYKLGEIAEIITRSAKLLGITIDHKAALLIAERSRSTPRTANHFLKRCRDVAQLQKKELNETIVLESLALLGIDPLGLSNADRKVLEILLDKFAGGPVGLSTLAAASGEEQETIEDVLEPFLIQLGFLERTPRGRLATRRAYEHLGRDLPKDRQDSLL